jgi:lipopolysaccharide transport system ATP-binding protein
MKQMALAVSGLGKAYAGAESPLTRLRSLFYGPLRTNDQWALSDISFSLGRGQCLGVVGDNGAGKSTLLKLIAGALQPTTGTVVRNGWLTAILELGAGFHPDFTGRQNLYFGGSLIGIDEAAMRELEPSIVDFAELHEAMDRPLKTYSSGMTVRLAFALVTAREPDVLIIDEALAVGDQHFQRKCVERIEAFRQNGSTILFCSHSLYHVRRLCDVSLWLDQGRVRALGDTETVLTGYESHVRILNAKADPLAPASVPDQHVPPPGEIAKILQVNVSGLGEGSPPRLDSPDLEVTVTAYVPDGAQPHIAVMLERSDRICVTAVGTHGDNRIPTSMGDGLWQATVTFPGLPLYSGEYIISAYLFDELGTLVYEQWLDCQRFMVVYPTLEVGLVRLRHEWS